MISAKSIYLVDDHSLVRSAMRCILSERGNMDVVGDSGDARRAVYEIEQLQPDVVLLDITMPGLSGIEAIPLIRMAAPGAKILMLSNHEGESFVSQAMGAGAAGYISKDADPEELTLAIEAVYRGGSFLSSKVARASAAGARFGDWVLPSSTTRMQSLTPRERQVFGLLALGRCNKDVAEELGVSLGTAKKHRENLQRKLRCRSSAELARLAIREGLLQA